MTKAAFEKIAGGLAEAGEIAKRDALIASQARRIEELEGAATDALASLVAAVSLLARGGKRAAPSDKMFAVMLADYNASIDRARATLKGETP